tara:strand:- start:570 stop:857 length:288 start_codon:yes stop_codon:yes gene_type:complete
MKINGLMDDNKIAWKKIPCCCDKSNPEKCHPISRHCKHCNCQEAENSMPRVDFEITDYETDENGRRTGEETKRMITEITIDRSTDGYDSIRGWTF